MSQVTLQGPFVGASLAAAASNGVPGVIADPPPAVTQLASGHLLQGEVVGRNDQGQTLVRTELGTLAVATKAQLPPGSQVTLQIRTAGAQLQIAVLQVDGHAPHLRGAGPATAAAAAPAAPSPESPLPRQVADQVVRPSTALPGTIADPPASIARLPAGTLLQGAVLGRDAAGHYLVRTEFGTLPLTTDVQLASGNRVSLRLTSLLPQVQVLVTPGEAPQQGPGGAARLTGAVAAGPAPAGSGTVTGAQAGPAASPHIASTLDILTVGQAVRALVISAGLTRAAAPAQAAGAGSPAGNPAGLPAGLHGGLPGPLGVAASEAVPGLPALPTGAALQLRITQVTPPEPAPPGTAPPEQSGAGAAGTGRQAVTAPAPPGGQPQPGVPPTAPGSVRLEGLVIGSTATGQPQVQTAAGLLTLEIGAQLPAGTRLALDLPTQQLALQGTPPGLPGAAALGLPEAAGDPIGLAYSWPALQRAVEGLESLDAVETRALLSPQGPAAPLPQPGPRLSSAMLFFINALSGGDPGAWLGDLMGGQAQRRLERAGQGDLLARLRGDLGGLSRLSDAAGDSWRLLPIPLYDGHQLQQMRLFLRQRRDRAKGRGKDGEATRFVLEVSLTRLGDLQLDGLVRRKRFDLILRSRQALPPAMRQDISGIFQSANEAAGSEGSITFQDSPDWQPMPIGAAATGLVV